MVQLRVRSFASRNQLAAYPIDRQKGQELEWERRYVTVLGAANKRLYQFRLQSTDKTFEQNPVRLITYFLIHLQLTQITLIRCFSAPSWQKHSSAPLSVLLQRLPIVLHNQIWRSAAAVLNILLVLAGGAFDDCSVLQMQRSGDMSVSNYSLW